MEITWFGQACFSIKSREARIVTDPFNDKYGLKVPKGLKADIVTVSHEHFDHNNVAIVETATQGQKPFIVRGPGEYEANGIEIVGVPSFHDNSQGQERGTNTIYVFKLEEMGVCHLGDLGHTLSDEELEKLNQVNILLIPVGGIYTLNAEKAAEVINQIEPEIVIPMHYQIEGLVLKNPIDPVDKFLKEVGAEGIPQEVLKISRNELPSEERKVVVLKNRN
ncbi:MAG: MBL fold metallo-hydrolase [Candidatus Berkelbacteria bacterium]|nr:MBL fold metallo-hydrolase [Candidatus Berkelbacteria bacterium]